MPTPRSRVVDESVTPWYHCISRCVRKAFLCGDGAEHRKAWIEARLQELTRHFGIDFAGYALLDNHLHVLLRLDSARVNSWSDQEIARRWATLFPIRNVDGAALPVSEARVSQLAANADWIAKTRARLADLGWFMKCLKEPLARMANKEDGCTGAFWEGRYKSIAVLDEESLLATAAYIDLNPLAAGAAATPEDSPYTSLHARIEHCRINGTLDSIRDDLSTLTRDPPQERGLWLLPLDDLRDEGSSQAGLMAGCTLSCYLRLVDWTSRLVRDGKAHLDAEVCSIFERLRVDSSAWTETMTRILGEPRRGGCYFGRPARLAEAARAHGRRWHRNQIPRECVRLGRRFDDRGSYMLAPRAPAPLLNADLRSMTLNHGLRT